MNATRPESSETREIKSPADSQKKLSPAGQHSIQGVQPTESKVNVNPLLETEQPELTASDPALQAELDEWKRTHDPANWEYKLGSPHAEYQFNKDLQAAERQHELGQDAAIAAKVSPGDPIRKVAEDLGGAIATTLLAQKEAEGTDALPMDQYFQRKYGTHP